MALRLSGLSGYGEKTVDDLLDEKTIARREHRLAKERDARIRFRESEAKRERDRVREVARRAVSGEEFSGASYVYRFEGERPEVLFDEEITSCNAYEPGDLCGGCDRCMERQFPGQVIVPLTVAELDALSELSDEVQLWCMCGMTKGCPVCRSHGATMVTRTPCDCDPSNRVHYEWCEGLDEGDVDGGCDCNDRVCARCGVTGWVVGDAPCPAGCDHGVVHGMGEFEGDMNDCECCAATGHWPADLAAKLSAFLDEIAAKEEREHERFVFDDDIPF